MTELKPCPRCGSENLNVMTEHTSGKLTVHCVDCGQFYHNLELSMEMSASEIFTKWNEYSKNYKQSEPKPDLKPCPFCGADNPQMSSCRNDYGVMFYTVECRYGTCRG